MRLGDATRSDLAELFSTVKRDRDHEPERSAPHQVLIDGDALVFERRAYELWLGLCEELRDSAYLKGGPGAQTIGKLLDRACVDSGVIGAQAAIAALERALDLPLKTWGIGVPINVSNLPNIPFRIGGCTIAPFPAQYHRLFTDRQQWYRFDGLLMSTTVEARDLQSALVRARDELDQAKAILGLIGELHDRDREYLWEDHESGAGQLSGNVGGESFHVILTDGRLPRGFRELSSASVADEPERADWEHRCMAACRWYDRGRRAASPSASLVMCMTALECMLVAGKREATKARTVAARATARPGGDDPQLIEWLSRLYSARNAAAHEGVSFLNEIELERLLALTRSVVLWGVAHLAPEHRSPPRACQTFTEANDPRNHPPPS